MLLRRELPSQFERFNRRHAAPFGPPLWRAVRYRVLSGRLWRSRFTLPEPVMRAMGPFAFQANSPTRRAEYPWAYHATPLSPGMRVLDVGAGAAGLQFLLARQGLSVCMVDPLINADEGADWTFTERDHARLCRALRAPVTFVRKFLADADLPAASFDRAMLISVIEHIPRPEAEALIREVARLLKPGGLCVMTVDLFLDLAPFTDQTRNRWGTNVPVRALVEASGLELVQGRTDELLGYPDFDPRAVLARREELMVSDDVAAQALVLRRPAA